MANTGPEIELLKPGMTTARVDKGIGWIQNLYAENNAMVLRDGFGEVTRLDCGLTAGIQSQDPELPYVSNATLSSATAGFGYKDHLGSYYLRTDFGHEQIVSVFSTYTALSGNSDNDNSSDWDANNTIKEPRGTSEVMSQFYVVSIYDITTDTRWEELLYRHTAENATNVNASEEMWKWRGVYNTTRNRDYQKFASFQGSTTSFYFAEYRDVVYFGNDTTGLWAYRPTIFKKARKPQVDTFWSVDETTEPWGESSKLVRVYFVEGFDKETYTYVSDAEIGKPSAVTVLGDRLVFGIGRTIYFSDGGEPNAVNAENFVSVPSQKEITSINGINGNLLIFTEDETFLYMPALNAEGLISGGRTLQISEGVGCVGPSSSIKVGNSLVWLDKNGVYKNNGSTGITSLTEPIDNFFIDGYSTNPLTSYFTQNGDTSSATVQPRLNFEVDMKTAQLAYDLDKDLLFVSFPANNFALVYKEGNWVVWNFESILPDGAAGAARVTVSQNIKNPWFITTGEDIYIVGGFDQPHILDLTIPRGSSAAVEPGYVETNQALSTGYYILKWGKGGALDRTSYRDLEDKRKFTGEWDTIHTTIRQETPTGTEYWTQPIAALGKPIRVPIGWEYYQGNSDPAGSTNTTVAVDAPTILVPVYVAMRNTGDTGVDSINTLLQISKNQFCKEIDLRFQFDDTHWKPIKQAGGGIGELVYLLPTERRWCGDDVFGGTGYELTAMATGNREVRLSDVAGAPVDPGVGGMAITIFGKASNFDDINNVNSFVNIKALASGLTRADATGFNFGLNRLNLICYIPFQRSSANTVENSWNIGAWIDTVDPGSINIQYDSTPFDPSVYTATTTDQTLRWVVWKNMEGLGFEYPVIDQLGNTFADTNQNTQPVDWCFKSEQIGIAEADQVKARGLYSQMKSTGVSTSKFFTNAFYGLYNTLTGSDWKGWSSQIIDYTTTEANVQPNIPINAKNPIRTRTRNLTENFHKRVFKDEALLAADQPAKWATLPNQAVGDYLIDEEEYDTLATSDSVKGKSITYMVFGFANNIAEKLKLASIKATLRRAGGRRRKGRSG